MNFSISNEDLSLIESNLSPVFEKLYNSAFFLTGAKGFFGIWIIESLLYLNEKDNLNITIYALTRSAKLFYELYPHLAQYKALKVIDGDPLNHQNKFYKLDYIIHAANYPYNGEKYWATKHLEYALKGTINITNLAKIHNVKAFLFTSSGSVYNSFHQLNGSCFTEESLKLDTSVPQIYSQAKILSEQILIDFYNNTKIPTTIARCFSFYGKHIPLQNFALGNFIENVIKQENIQVMGDGKSQRTYMYAPELMSCLFYLLLSNTKLETINIGSDKAVSIKELACFLSEEYHLPLVIHNKEDNGVGPKHYIPCIDKLNTRYKQRNKIFFEKLLKFINYLK